MNRYANLMEDPEVEIICDMRSDTVTRPDAGMCAAMTDADVGDDVMGEDPSTNALEARLAEMLGKEAAFFVTSGTQGNFTGLLGHCGRDEEILVGCGYHVHTYEAAGTSVLGGIALHPIEPEADDLLAPGDIAAAVKGDDPHLRSYGW